MPRFSPALLSPVLRRLWWDWVSPYKRLIALDLIFTLGQSISTSLYPLLITWAINHFEQGVFDEMMWLPVAIVAVTAFKGMTLYMQTTLTNKIASLVLRDLQNAAFLSLNRADILQIGTEAPASLAQRFYAEMIYIQITITRLMTSLVGDSLMIAGLVATMFYIDWKLAIAGLAILPFAILPVAEVGKRLRANAFAAQSMIGSMTSFLTEALAGARLIRTYQLEDYMVGRGKIVFDKIHGLRLRAANLFARVEPILEVLGGLAVALVLVLIGWRISSGATSLGQFAGFIGALLLAAQPMRKLGNVNAVLQEGLAAVERVFALLDLSPNIRDKRGAPPLRIDAGTIEFKNVGFYYADGTKALDGVSFTVPGGKKVALVGRSGAGKSTLFNLIPRLYEAQSGQILIDNQEIKDISLPSLRESISLVSQDVIIFQDTVKNNIALGRLDASKQQIEDAAKAAAAHQFIAKLSQGYATPLGEGSTLLSGGERQRIALARALLRDAPLLLLDEATSALDSESEHLVQQALNRLTKGRTTLIIAHRLVTVRSADLIVVMEAGRVIETGTHDELLKAKGAYALLYERQFHNADGVIRDE
jgi:subfamily B ATP-binding cassette protein MsbA